MTQREAASILWTSFYEWHPAPWGSHDPIPFFRRADGTLVPAPKATPLELQQRRARLLPAGFSFDWQRTRTF